LLALQFCLKNGWSFKYREFIELSASASDIIPPHPPVKKFTKAHLYPHREQCCVPEAAQQ